MLFNTLEFGIFLPLVFLIYWLIGSKYFQYQNAFILIASYYFYASWDPRFLILIAFSTLADFLIAQKIKDSNKTTSKKILVWTSVAINIGILGFFKYSNFFIENFITAFTFFGTPLSAKSLDIILPVGISFYTFQTLSYTIDVYRGKINASSNLVQFSAYVSFFPQLVAGPIERASNFLPQFESPRKLDYSKSVDGLRQILWGLFKKMIIADTFSIYVDEIFTHYETYPGSTLIFGGMLFAFQIYADFSGYSDIAIGTARLFGFELKQNFKFPYFSRDIAEFWRRWHISLSTWFRDYVYIPLGGSKGTKLMTIRNVFVLFLISGFWHGANWTFIFWGLYHAFLFLPLLLLSRNRQNITQLYPGQNLPSFKEFLLMIYTFFTVLIGWIFFRSESVGAAFSYLERIVSKSSFSLPFLLERSTNAHVLPKSILTFIVLFLCVEWQGRNNNHALEKLFDKQRRIFRWLFYYFLIILILIFKTDAQQFIYFQF